ncbi:MAG: sugar kinase, partial [Flavobacteriaceae bacterium CG_4_8_14_3_um_filter_34_10]
MHKLLIVGTVAFDAIETPFGKTDKILGGAATYIGLAASQFKADAAIVSVVGGDFPKKYLDLLVQRNIDISALEVVENGKTFFWSGKYKNDLNSRDTLDTQLNVLADFNPKVPESFKNAGIVMLGNLHPAVQNSVIDQMTTEPELIILDTMNFWMDNTLEELKKVIAKVDV